MTVIKGWRGRTRHVCSVSHTTLRKMFEISAFVCVLCALACAVKASAESACPAKERDADQLVKVGRMLMKNKQTDQAKDCFQKAVQANPRSVCLSLCLSVYVGFVCLSVLNNAVLNFFSRVTKK